LDDFGRPGVGDGSDAWQQFVDTLDARLDFNVSGHFLLPSVTIGIAIPYRN
jgi:hypothetical protein